MMVEADLRLAEQESILREAGHSVRGSETEEGA